MPQITFPNQRVVKVHREPLGYGFLGINNENWTAAARDLSAHALKLYLYFASNKDNFDLALSPAAIHSQIGMPQSTYRDQFNILVNKGYLVPSHGNTFDFFEVPQARPAVDAASNLAGTASNFEDNTAAGSDAAQAAPSKTGQNREINNKDNLINNGINISEFIPKVKEIAIPIPKAEGTKKMSKIELPKQGEFVF